MFNIPSPPKSTSIVISHISKSYTENDLITLFSDLPPNKVFKEQNSNKINVKQVIFHHFGPNIFLNKATIVFDDEESAKRVAFAFIGKMIGNKKMTIQYSYKPYPPFDQLITFMKPLDDVGIPNEFNQDNVYQREWMELTKIPSNIPQDTAIICLRFNLIDKIIYKDIHPSWDTNFQIISYLNLKGNDIESIEDNISFPNITFCDLSYNKLTKSPKFSTFCPKIEIIFLNNNQITDLDSSIFSTSLKSLNIQYNHIKHIPKLPCSANSFVFDHNDIETIDDFSVESINSVTITHNKISEIPKFDSSLLLNYSYNSIIQLNINTFPQLLTTLVLRSNQISEIPQSLFTNFPELTKVDFSKNFIKEIPETFSISKLTSFNISFNPKLKILPKIPQCLADLRVSFCELTDLESFIPNENNLVILYANGNKIRKIPDYLNKLEVFFAADNLITDFPLLYHIQKDYTRSDSAILDLSHNYIKEITLKSFGENVKIPTFNLIDLSYNDLKQVPFAKLFTRKSQIKLSGNNNLGSSTTSNILDSKIISNIDSIDISHTLLAVDGNYSDMLREVITDNPIKLSDEKIRDSISPLTQNLAFKYNSDIKGEDKPHRNDVGYSEMIGDRNDMEDALIIQQDIFQSEVDMFALFDGHNGFSSSRLAASGFPSALGEIKDIFIKSPFEAINSIIANLNKVLNESNDMSGTTLDIVIVDKQNKIKDDKYDNEKNSKETENSGRILITHIGDSRVLVINEEFNVRFVTEDMRCDSSRTELERLRAAKVPCRRMKAGGRLGVSASVGDILYPGVRHTPINYEIKIEETDRWIVIACDGVFEEMENQDVADILRFAMETNLDEKGSSVAKRAATLIRDFAFECGSTDNISVIVVDLKPF
ncbi:hypothetical protein M9Y10_029415 [Tritrichomonas musculus]|uniref:PPM-type phosphatase domain-containing protein n=1 Tax=Tritrichomonas musculus TaxID=1915356 RepID=A0ABR2KM38_9EUKA